MEGFLRKTVKRSLERGTVENALFWCERLFAATPSEVSQCLVNVAGGRARRTSCLKRRRPEIGKKPCSPAGYCAVFCENNQWPYYGTPVQCLISMSQPGSFPFSGNQ